METENARKSDSTLSDRTRHFRSFLFLEKTEMDALIGIALYIILLVFYFIPGYFVKNLSQKCAVLIRCNLRNQSKAQASLTDAR